VTLPARKWPAPSVGPDSPRLKEAPRAPTADEWAAMTPAEQDEAVAALVASESQEEIDVHDAMAEGDPHLDAKMNARDTLRAYFGRRDRRIYIGAEIKVFYPGEKGFTPDVIAVNDVDQRPRNCWMVSKEGKGIDLALEVHYEGDWRKDFVDNVKKYAGLGIREYFIYDIKRERVKGYRLPRQGGTSYQGIRPRAGRYPSEVLGLELAVEAGQLRFYDGTAELVTAAERIEKLERMVEAAAAQAEEEQSRAEQEQALVERAISQLASAILMILRLRGLTVDDEVEARILGVTDLALLERWLQRAATIAAPEQLFLDS
jgi:Uma2 family endonuclease